MISRCSDREGERGNIGRGQQKVVQQQAKAAAEQRHKTLKSNTAKLSRSRSLRNQQHE